MGLGATVGADLLAVPFPKMVFDLARAIANGQTALDRASISTLRVLARTEFDYIPEITEVISAGPVDTVDGVPVTGVDVTTRPGRTLPLSLLQAGLTPSFYQFTESVIEVKMSISSKVSTQSGSSSAPRWRPTPASCSRRPRSARTSTTALRTRTRTPRRARACCGPR